ncbi:hypothetical protein FRC09_013767 [Ceratobasidium sp. 395]|nr:hypothetical protein FRC09_013767 [Ceratobasidium sp. 395]
MVPCKSLSFMISLRLSDQDTQDSYYLAQYLSGLEQARNQELEAIKNQRRQPIHERLFGLGWTAEDVRVHEAYAKDWNALVEVARPLSDPEGSRQTKGRETRHKRVKDLLIEYSRTAHPFNNILIKFWRFVWYPQPNPLPDMDTLLGWDLIRDLYEADISIDVVNERFKERIPKLEPRLAAWRAKTEKRLIDNLKLERKPGPETQLEVRRETEATKDLPASTRFLLRADTIFKTPTEQGSSHSRSEFGGTSPMLLYYPYLLFSPEDSEVSGTIPLKPTDLSKFTRHTEAEKIAKALLADMRTPHVTYLELQEMGAWFTCLRCHLREPKTWEGMIEHYREMNEKWENETRRRPKQTTKHKIVFANAHELRPRAGIELERLMLPNHLMKRDKEKSPGGMQVVSDWLAFDDIRLHARYNPALAECACGYR